MRNTCWTSCSWGVSKRKVVHRIYFIKKMVHGPKKVENHCTKPGARARNHVTQAVHASLRAYQAFQLRQYPLHFPQAFVFQAVVASGLRDEVISCVTDSVFVNTAENNRRGPSKIWSTDQSHVGGSGEKFTNSAKKIDSFKKRGLDNAPKHTHNTPKHMQNTQKHMHNTPNHTHNTPKHMYNTSNHMYNTPKHMYNTPKHMHNAPKRMSCRTWFRCEVMSVKGRAATCWYFGGGGKNDLACCCTIFGMEAKWLRVVVVLDNQTWFWKCFFLGGATAHPWLQAWSKECDKEPTKTSRATQRTTQWKAVGRSNSRTCTCVWSRLRRNSCLLISAATSSGCDGNLGVVAQSCHLIGLTSFVSCMPSNMSLLRWMTQNERYVRISDVI